MKNNKNNKTKNTESGHEANKNNRKSAKKLERHFKGAANHNRINILRFVEKRGEVSLEEILGGLRLNEKTASGHTRRLVEAGLMDKHYQGRNVMHSLSPYGKMFCDFMKRFG